MTGSCASAAAARTFIECTPSGAARTAGSRPTAAAGSTMDELATRIAATSDEFRANHAAMQSLVDQLRAAEAKARAGGGTKAHERHRVQGKLPVRERLDRVLDPGSPFLELSPLAAWGMYDDEAPGAGIVTGVGRVSGREVLIVANDATVKGGTYYPITVRKHLRAQEV